MRIGIVCYPTIGGSGVVATEMAHNLALRGHEVHLLSYDRPSRLRRGINRLRFHKVEVSAYPLFRYPPYDLALATRLLEVQEEAQIDIFHVHYAIPHAVSAFLARSMSGSRFRFVTTLHGTDITVTGSDRSYMRPTRFAIDQSDAVTAVSKYLADETQLVFGVNSPIEVIPNFVDTDKYRPSAEPRWPDREDGERILMHASNFRPVKRVADIVRAFSRIQATVPARLLLVGEGPDREHALAVAADLGCLNRVEWLGPKASIDDTLGSVDLFLSASETESFGLSILEAMSCGVPCISTRVGGVGEVLGDTVALTPLGDPEAMAKGALELLQDRELYAQKSAAVRARAKSEFATDAVIDRYLALYSQVLDRD
ncbi:MAG: N-acetyl-alpha-D-glucosaminyl L-malate synthase BshA [Planctomycetota bacterium]|nr:N-acetyl-alpha-D-glucosaminyl L-malate synthase BshA [Planctomycetota bacterium]